MRSSREGRSRYRGGSKKGEQGAPKGPEKVPQGPQPPSRREKEAMVPREAARPRESMRGQRSDHVNLRLNLLWSISSLFLTMALLLVMQFPRARAFTAYNCSNRSNNVEVFSLLEPASCHAASINLRVERTLPAEIIQVKKTRMVPVFRCLAVETEVSQYCGHSSAAGVMQFFRFRETTVVDPQACRDAFSNKGLIEVGVRSS